MASMSQPAPGSLKTFAFRLKPHQDVKKAIIDFAKQNKIKAGFILTAVGSVEQANLRYANKSVGTILRGSFEVVSLTGTFSDTSSHLHLSISDSGGKTIGGHLLEENLVYTTLEIVVGEMMDVEFIREKDTTYGYDELKVQPRKK
jgi:predicted DNA-binding protein with PD1-like motif